MNVDSATGRVMLSESVERTLLARNVLTMQDTVAWGRIFSESAFSGRIRSVTCVIDERRLLNSRSLSVLQFHGSAIVFGGWPHDYLRDVQKALEAWQ
ncbi:hypothetical protein J6590_046012 [Homalodisca vitripennis]|nr:hypothetical protein J6590_046012 [Homalodisca vitripennis]